MITQLIGLLFLGLTSLSYAQSELEAKNVSLNNVIISSNSKYINKAYDESSAQQVKEFQQFVADYKIKESKEFNPEFDNYLVSFNNNKTKIKTTYDTEGNIITSDEKFNDVLVPNSVRHALYKNYPGWTMNSNTYKVKYVQNKETKREYKIQMTKNGEKKNLKIDVIGNMAIVSN